ncbi:MAG: AAA family ATPase [Nitrososphaerales archaeon]
MAEPFLVVFAGAPGVGKSTLARALARELHAAYLDKGTIKDAALGLGRELKIENAQQFAAALSYSLLIPLARDNLTVGTQVIVDSPAGYRGFQDAIEQLVRSVKVDFRLVECISTDEALLRERIERRGPDLPDHRVRDWDAYQQARERLERMSGPRLVVDTAEPVSINLRKIMNALGLSAAENRATVAAESTGAEGAVDEKKTENS